MKIKVFGKTRAAALVLWRKSRFSEKKEKERKKEEGGEEKEEEKEKKRGTEKEMLSTKVFF